MKNKPDQKINQHLIDCFCFLCITDTTFLRKVRKVVEPRHFLRNELVKDCLTLCYDIFDISGEVLFDNFHDELIRFMSKFPQEKKELYVTYIEKLQELQNQNLNKEYVLSRVNDFVLYYEFDEAAYTFAEMTRNGEYEKAREYMNKILRKGIKEVELGYDWSNLDLTPPYLSETTKEETLIPFGLPVIDSIYRKGIRRTDLICVGGQYKGGKTWFLHHLGILGVEHGWKVLHVTHENSREETWMRYDMLVSGRSNEEHAQSFNFVERDNNGVVLSQSELEVGTIYDYEPVLADKKVLLKGGGRLWVQDYPPRRCSIGQLGSYIDRLEMEGFMPDIVINDYIEKMYMGENSNWQTIDDMFMESKAIAKERGLAMITASQVTTDNLDKVIKSQGAVAGARSKVGDVDLMLMLSQNTIQKENGITVAYVTANRHGKQGFGCYYDSVIGAGEVVQNCWPLRNSEET